MRQGIAIAGGVEGEVERSGGRSAPRCRPDQVAGNAEHEEEGERPTLGGRHLSSITPEAACPGRR